MSENYDTAFLIGGRKGSDLTPKKKGKLKAQEVDWSSPYFSFDVAVEQVERDGYFSLVAKQFIPKGTAVWNDRVPQHPSLKLKRCTREEIELMTEEDRVRYLNHTWQDDVDLFVGNFDLDAVRRDALNSINHSCDPNLWFATDNRMVARRDIPIGEEFSFDYAMCDACYAGVDKCLCGSDICRGSTSPEDYKNPVIQKQYGNHFRFFILNLIDEEVKKGREADKTPAAAAAAAEEKRLPSFANADGSDKLVPLTDKDYGVGKMWQLHRSIECRGSEVEGRGLFATHFIPKNTIVWQEREFCDDVFLYLDGDEISHLTPEMHRLCMYYGELDLDTGKHKIGHCPEVIERDASNFWNHSCDPNTWLIGDEAIATRRDIFPGEELTFDYGTSKPLPSTIDDCRCGSPLCRRAITTDDWQLPELQRRYGVHWLSMWLEKQAQVKMQQEREQQDTESADAATATAAAASAVAVISSTVEGSTDAKVSHKRKALATQ